MNEQRGGYSEDDRKFFDMEDTFFKGSFTQEAARNYYEDAERFSFEDLEDPFGKTIMFHFGDESAALKLMRWTREKDEKPQAPYLAKVEHCSSSDPLPGVSNKAGYIVINGSSFTIEYSEISAEYSMEGELVRGFNICYQVIKPEVVSYLGMTDEQITAKQEELEKLRRQDFVKYEAGHDIVIKPGAESYFSLPLTQIEVGSGSDATKAFSETV